MELLNIDDIILIKKLKARKYAKNSMMSSCTKYEKEHFDLVKAKLKGIASFFAGKYEAYGPFEYSANTGNPLSIGGKKLNRVWSGIFKGAQNKQYAAQISFVIDPDDACLNVGFYFGRMSSHVKLKENELLKNNLFRISNTISTMISNNDNILDKYYTLKDCGFNAYYNDDIVNMNDWLSIIKTKPNKCELIAKLHPDQYGNIEYSLIDFYVNQILFLMSCVNAEKNSMKMPPMSMEKRARQAELLAKIGEKGELFILEEERKKLKSLGLLNKSYPKHVSRESDSYGYDILSKDMSGNEIYIEVKTTTRKEGDIGANKFYLSTNEYQVFLKDKKRYKLYRVYDIEGSPKFREFNIDDLELIPDGYLVNC